MTKEELQELGFSEKEIDLVINNKDLTIEKIQQLLSRGWAPGRIATSAAIGILPDYMIESKGKKVCKTKREFADDLTNKFKEYIGKISDKFNQLLANHSLDKIEQYSEEIQKLEEEKQQFVEQEGNDVYDNLYTTSSLNQVLEVESHLKKQKEIYEQSVKNGNKKDLSTTKQALDKSQEQFQKVVENHPTYMVYKEFEDKISILEALRMKQQNKMNSKRIVDKIKPTTVIPENSKLSIKNIKFNLNALKTKTIDKLRMDREQSGNVNIAVGVKNVISNIGKKIERIMAERAADESFDEYQKTNADEEVTFTPEMMEPQDPLESDQFEIFELNIEESYSKLKYVYENDPLLANHINMMLDQCVIQIKEDADKTR